MKRPYIVCHMMASLDGRIDCSMTEKIAGVDTYYHALAALNLKTTVSGKTTAKMELTSAPDFSGDAGAPVGTETFYRVKAADGYSIVTDTRGTLGWEDNHISGKPLLILTSEQAGEMYLANLKAKGISYIACGKKHIDLPRAVELLGSEFHVERMGIVGGGTINAGFLDAGLLDEISMVYGPAIDGRGGMKTAFDGLPRNREPFQLRLKSAKSFPDDAVWLRYSVEK